MSFITRKGPRRRPIADINIVPYIDVTLVLLTIFMVTAPLLQTGVGVELQAAREKAFDPTQDLPIIVTLKAGGEIFLDAGNESDLPVNAETLPTRVIQAMQKKPGLAVLIRGDKRVDYGRVLQVFSSLRQAGIRSVNLMTGPVEE